jgi:hypothetical protein
MKPNHQKRRFVTRQRDHTFESNGPNGKLRGQPHQLVERYMMLGKEALGARDSLLAENYFQYAEHYRRVVGAQRSEKPAEGEKRVRPEGGERSLEPPAFHEEDSSKSNAFETPRKHKQSPESRPESEQVESSGADALPPFLKTPRIPTSEEESLSAENSTVRKQKTRAETKVASTTRKRRTSPKKKDESAE